MLYKGLRAQMMSKLSFSLSSFNEEKTMPKLPLLTKNNNEIFLSHKYFQQTVTTAKWQGESEVSNIYALNEHGKLSILELL